MVGLRRCAGFTLAELLVAMAVTLVALGLAVSLLQPVAAAFNTLPEAADAQQRLRVAAQTLAEDIMAAGAGPVTGWGGRAIPVWPAVLPCRWTGEPLATRPDGCARDDAISVVAMPLAAPQAVVSEDLAAPGAALHVASVTACVLSHPACRFHEDARAIVADGSGAWDILQVSAVSIDGLELEHGGSALSRLYRAGALIGETGSKAYSLRLDPATGALQLRRSTDGAADMPLLDHVTSLRFDYFGRPEPPAVADDGDLDRRRASYGPLPPPDGVDDELDAWLPGENCQFSRFEGQPVARQATLPVEAAGLARLPLSTFTDGPWCPDEGSLNRYDADLLRTRLVRITVRVQARSSAVRGLDPRLFFRPGVAREAARLVPDLEVRVDAALRNR
ncbi:MAG: prepilin-type N-terminal cleavage/methylation domain-containing protein [Vicinamibacterales bacterium]